MPGRRDTEDLSRSCAESAISKTEHRLKPALHFQTDHSFVLQQGIPQTLRIPR